MITIKFSCDLCGVKDAIVLVPQRAQEMDVRRWVMNVVGQRITDQHRMLSPSCRATTISAIKIPLDRDDEDGWIGKQTDQVPPDGDGFVDDSFGFNDPMEGMHT